MKVIFKDFKAGDLKLLVENMDDLWYLSHIIDEGDSVKGKTFRKIKIGQEPNIKVVKKVVFLKINVEKVEFHMYTNSLRISGKITEGTEEAPKGSYHTFDVNEQTILSLHKPKWYTYQIEKVNDAVKDKGAKVLICVLDRENAGFALLKNYGYAYLSELESDMRKKGDIGKEKSSNYYTDIVLMMQEYAKRYQVQHIILASPAFWKEDVLKVVSKKASELISKITLATCNNIGKNGINEVLKRDEVKGVLARDRAAQEIVMVEELLKEISQDGNCAYGIKEVQQASDAGAISTLLVLDALIQEYRSNNTYAELDAIMKAVDTAKGEVHIISSEHEGGSKLKGIGGIGALLRYKINY